MSALDIELATMRGFASCSGDYARIDEAEAELAALRGELERLRDESARLSQSARYWAGEAQKYQRLYDELRAQPNT